MDVVEGSNGLCVPVTERAGLTASGQGGEDEIGQQRHNQPTVPIIRRPRCIPTFCLRQRREKR